MEVKKLFALASVTALTGFVAAGMSAACSSDEVVTIKADSGTSSGSVNKTDSGKPKSGTSSGAPTDDDDDDDTATPSCLSKDPIDATKIAYSPSNAPLKDACTKNELAAFSQYYKDHASEDNLIDTWGSSVGDTCKACIFTDTTAGDAKTWGPMVIGLDTDGNKAFQVNSGGCIEVASGSAECGQDYFQFQTCTLQACLKDCKSQTDFTKCRQDQAVLTTSCKDSYNAMKTSCGAKLGAAQTTCKGTSYTFEGPINVLCIKGGGTSPDGGLDAGKDSGNDGGDSGPKDAATDG